MKIAVVGAGAIGGYLGTKLSVTGEDVCFIARNRNLAAINANGFKLIQEDGSELHARGVRAYERCADAGPQDAVLLTVKAHQVRDLLPELRGLFGPATMLVSFINGVPWWYFNKLAGPYEGRTLQSLDPDGLIAAQIEPERIIGGVVYPASELTAPGVVKLIEGNRFSLGELDGSRSERIETLSKAMMNAGFKSPVSRDIRSEIWVKLWGNLTFNPISALTHATLQDICRFPPTRALAEAMMGEAKAVAEKLGVVFKISLAQRIAGHRELTLEGMCTHFAVADEPERGYTEWQLERFAGVRASLAAVGVTPSVVHAANSAAAIGFPASRFDMVRTGLAIYGVTPGPGIGADLGLRPALALRSRVSYVKRLYQGDAVSYGLRYELGRDATIATVPIGYADGVPRNLGAAGAEVLLHGRRFPMAGTVTMDQLLIDVGDEPVAVGDVVTFLGQDGSGSVTAEEWAEHLGTIGYEIVCSIGPRVPREYRS